MPEQILPACRHTLKHNLDVKKTDRVLIVTDENKRTIADVFLAASQEFTPDVELIEMATPRFNGAEPADPIAAKMSDADVILMPLTKSISWTAARMAATGAGARIASMPRITEEIILRTFPIDYRPIRERANALCDLLDEANEIHLETTLGTDLTFSVAGRKGHGRKGGIYTEPGYWGNLPCGEAFIAPVEGSAEGVYFVDASHAGIGASEAPIEIRVEKGRAVAFRGGQAAALRDMLKAIGDENAFNIAEFGIGCNDKARICGITLEDEKVLGTCHIALGSNIYFGGQTVVGVHVDGVIKGPKVYFDSCEIEIMC